MKLKRSLNLPLVALYGLGNILGAGIYVLVGKVAGFAGSGATLAFIVAMVIATFTAFAYMELSGRYPVSASVSVYLHKAFGKRWLSVAVGMAMVLSGIASAAALSQGFAGYLQSFVNVPTSIASAGLIVILGLLAIKGIGESVKAAVVLTAVEIIGLLLVIWFGRGAFSTFDFASVSTVDPTAGIGGLVAGAFLAFYAFIGFEDMVNVGEETKNPQRTMPIAILIALIGSTLLYIFVAIVATSLVTPAELAQSNAPLSLVMSKTEAGNLGILGFIGMIATINGVIVQIIMGSRILYGLSKQGWLPRRLSVLHASYQTPVTATVIILGIMILGTVLFPLVSLAQVTSLLVLSIFIMVNVALIVVKRRKPTHNGYISVPMALPYIGAALCFSMIAYQVFNWV